jgi:hypothetical protein
LAVIMAAGLVASGLVVALPPASALAETSAKEKTMTPQQRKMKECAVKWGEEKAKTDKKGRAAYNEFMRGCPKKSPGRLKNRYLKGRLGTPGGMATGPHPRPIARY